MARVLGVEVLQLTMFPTRSGEMASAPSRSAAWLSGSASVHEQQRANEIDAIISLAGPHAECKFRGKVPSKPKWDYDLANAQAAIARAALLSVNPIEAPQLLDVLGPNERGRALTPSESAEAKRLWKHLDSTTRNLIEENWPAIERVANAALRLRILTEGEIDTLIKTPQAFSAVT